MADEEAGRGRNVLQEAADRLHIVQEAKAFYSTLSIDIKRSLYKCGERFLQLKDIQIWPDYFRAYELRPKSTDIGYDEKLFTPNDEINSKISLWQGDITTLEIDAIVNSANESLQPGGGVDGAIHAAAGPELLNECQLLDICHTGDAKLTAGYQLPAKYIIHTVGPTNTNSFLLRSCYQKSFDLMMQQNLRSIAFPCISTGIYEYPSDNAAHVALLTTRKFLLENHEKVDRVIFAVYLDKDKKLYEELMQKYFPVMSNPNIPTSNL